MSSKKIFLDTSVFEAFIDRANTNHLRAVDLMNKLAKDSCFVFTSQSVVEETYTILERRVSSVVACEFLQALIESHIDILFPTKSELLSFYKLMLESKDKSITLRMGINGVLMKKSGINYVATFGFWNNLLGIMQYI